MFFGLDRATDEQSLLEFMHHFTDTRLLPLLTARMSEEEIHQVIDLLSAIMKNHLTGDEYHRLFLQEEHHHH